MYANVVLAQAIAQHRMAIGPTGPSLRILWRRLTRATSTSAP
jgi:hypothetical protein